MWRADGAFCSGASEGAKECDFGIRAELFWVCAFGGLDLGS